MEGFSRLVGDAKDDPPEVKFDKEVNANISNALTLLEEFHCMMEMIRDESREITEDVLQGFRATSLKFQTLYAQINDLERFVKHIEENCNVVAESLEQAELQYNTFSLFKSTLRRMISSETQPEPSRRSNASSYSPPDIFSTSELITSKEVSED